jgi:hypothetical protein
MISPAVSGVSGGTYPSRIVLAQELGEPIAATPEPIGLLLLAGSDGSGAQNAAGHAARGEGRAHRAHRRLSGDR